MRSVLSYGPPYPESSLTWVRNSEDSLATRGALLCAGSNSCHVPGPGPYFGKEFSNRPPPPPADSGRLLEQGNRSGPEIKATDVLTARGASTGFSP